MSVKTDSVRTLLFQFFGLGAGIVTNVVVARTLGPEGKGLLSYLGSALFVAVSLGGLGLSAAAVQHLGKRRFPPETVAATQALLGLATGLVAAGITIVALTVIPSRIEVAPMLILPFAVVIVFALVQTDFVGVMVGVGRIRAANRVQAIVPSVWLVGSLILLAWMRLGATAAALAWMAAQVASAVAAVVWVVTRIRPRFRRLGPCARASLGFGFEAYLANLLWALLLRSDSLLLGWSRGMALVGIYSIAVLLAELLWYLPRSLTFALSARVTSATTAEAISLVQRAARIGLWAVIAAGALLAAVSPFLIRLLLGPAFAASYRPLLLLLPGILAGAIAAPLSLFLTQHRGKPRVNAWISGLGLLVNLALNLWWIPRHGASGAAASSSIAYALVALLLVWHLRREPGFSWLRLLLLRRGDVDEAVALLRRRPGIPARRDG